MKDFEQRLGEGIIYTGAMVTTGMVDLLALEISDHPLIQENGHDFFLGMTLYFGALVTSLVLSPKELKRPHEISFLVAGCIGVITELAQKYGNGQGTYDPKDIVAFIAGPVIAWSADRITKPERLIAKL